MNFESPSALLLGLALPVILALWLLAPRRIRLRTPSLLLWRGAEVERHSARPWQRLRNHPLLWLQLLVAALLVATALRPFQPASNNSQHLVILLDASGSMRATDVSPDRFSVARNRAIDVARGLGPGQRVSLVRLDEAPRVLVSLAGANEVERLLSRQEAGFGSADLAAALVLAEALSPGEAEIVLITDGSLVVAPNATLPPGTSLRTVLVGPPRAGGNVAITGLRVRVEGDRASVQAGVRNTGAALASGGLVLYAEEAILGAQEWTLGPGEERHLTWSGVPADGRWFEARLADLPAAANALSHDDRAWAGIAAVSERRVLLVSDGSTFLERALAVVGSVRAERVATNAWEPSLLQADYDLVVFNGIWPLDAPSSNALLVGQPAAESFRPGRVTPSPAHPLLRYVDWSDVSIAAARQLPVDGSWDVVIDSDGGPLLAVREIGARREAALAFDMASSDLALRPAFPVLMANLIEWLAPGGEGEPLVVAPGEPVRIEPNPLSESIRVEGDSGAAQELAPPWPPAGFRAPAPGLYRVVQSGQNGRQERLLIASGYLVSEADLAARPLSIEAKEGDSRLGLPDAARSPWPLLAVALIVVSVAEWWVDARGR